MIRNYFIIAIRSLWRNKLITLINLLGMALGFGIFLTLMSMVRYEMQYDRFHEDIDNMHILHVRLSLDDSEYTSERTGGIFARVLSENFPSIYASCRISEPLEFELGVQKAHQGPDPVGEAEQAFFAEDEVLAVDSTFFHFFTFPLLKGDLNEVFKSRDHIVITASMAEKLFGDRDPMGQSISMGELGYFQVAGVAADPPEQSTYQFEALVGFHVLEQLGYPVDNEGGTMYYTNFKLEPGTDLEELNPAIQEYIEENLELEMDAVYFMDTLERVRLHGENLGMTGVLINLFMALIIMAIACINFINLSTAYASERHLEISIRKSAGASKRQLVMQFLGETYLLLLLAFYLGLFLAENLLPALSRAFGETRQADFSGPGFWALLFFLYLLTGLMAGLYPAMKIAGIKPNRRRSGKKSRNVSRKILIVVQFTFSILFTIVALFVIRQFSYLREADLGFNRDEVLYVRTTGEVWNSYPEIRDELLDLHFVQGVTTASDVPVMLNSGTIGWGERDNDNNAIAVVLETDAYFLETMEIDLLEGRYFSPGNDSLNAEYVVVNQSVVDLLEMDDPVGTDFWLYENQFTILGVTDNIDFFPFNMEIFQEKALIYRYQEIRDYIFIRTGPITPDQMAALEEIFKRHNPAYDFSADYVRDFNYDMMEDESGLNFMFKMFSFLAVFIAIMGIVGLSVYNNNRRKREVGIRKAMGAQEEGILSLLLSEYMRLVLISNVLGQVGAYFLVRRILQFFSYSVELSPWVFIMVFAGSLFLSFAVVALLAIRTVRSNPVDSLRYE